jgi:hypothetical protein
MDRSPGNDFEDKESSPLSPIKKRALGESTETD